MITQPRTIDANPRDPAFYQDPYPVYAAHRDGQLHHWPAYDMWCALSYSTVDTVLRDRRFARVLTDDEGVRSLPISDSTTTHLADFQRVEQHSLLNLEPPKHTAVRALVNRAFIKRNVESMRADIHDLVTETINGFRDRRRVELLSEFATIVPATIIARMIGVPDNHIPQLLSWSNTMVKLYTMTQTVQEEVDANDAAREFAAFLSDLIELRRRKPREDLLSHLVNARVDARQLSTEEVISTVVLLLNAGHEATVHQTGNAVKTLLEQHESPAKWFESREQSHQTIDELIRFDAPLHLFVRIAKEPVTIGSVDFQRGDKIALLLAAANRDSERFKQADKFDPARADGGHLSLGAGQHFCVGAQLARVELEIMLSQLFSLLPNLELAEVPRYRDTYHFHGLESLDLSW